MREVKSSVPEEGRRTSRSLLSDSLKALENVIEEIRHEGYDTRRLLILRSRTIRVLYWCERVLTEERFRVGERESEGRGKESRKGKRSYTRR
ncbi:MAG: hypothetical protein QXV05_05435 [Candidatus Korarchaeum sp.]